MDEAQLPVTRIEVRENGKKLFLQLEGMKSDHVIYLHLNRGTIKSSSGELLWSTETWYTMNNIPGR
ncbi:MAG: hypothetical protein J0H29_10950 [Sphingobacteriales bacterium]|nr:hypothetical protein [Sphingobacteriales bacterium]